MEDMNFVLPNNYPLDMTYHHYNGFATSQIDYILPFRDKSFVKHNKVLQRACTNTSTHDLVIGHIFCHNGLWRACSSLCSSVCVLSSVMEILSSVCVSAHVLLSSTVSFLFAFHWLMRWAFLFLVEGERCFFFWAWLVTCPVFSTGFFALIHISLTDIALELTCRSQVNFPIYPCVLEKSNQFNR